MSLTTSFIAAQATPEDYWRSIILFGRNVASYKFALGLALLDVRPRAGQLVTLEELAVPFTAHLCSHLRQADKQSTSRTSRFLEACRKANDGEISQDALVGQAVQLGFNNVIDAFHVVAGASIPDLFFLDERRSNRGIRMTEAFSELAMSSQSPNLVPETDARWRLVETAWALGLSPSLLASVGHDSTTQQMHVTDTSLKRKPVTGAREALSGYQKGHCFYCFDSFSLTGSGQPDVDHFLPHALKPHMPGVPIDGIWNLVLACTRCNRGTEGKHGRAPSFRLLPRLHLRNEYLVGSHHPLRDTIIAQTGRDAKARQYFLATCHAEAMRLLVHEWHPVEVSGPPF